MASQKTETMKMSSAPLELMVICDSNQSSFTLSQVFPCVTVVKESMMVHKLTDHPDTAHTQTSLAQSLYRYTERTVILSFLRMLFKSLLYYIHFP